MFRGRVHPCVRSRKWLGVLTHALALWLCFSELSETLFSHRGSLPVWRVEGRRVARRAGSEAAPEWAVAVASRQKTGPKEENRPEPIEVEVVETEVVSGDLNEDELQKLHDEVQHRIASGRMNFIDFYAIMQSMAGSDSKTAPQVPAGYREIIEALTTEERESPALFTDGSLAADVRIDRVIGALPHMNDVEIRTFLSDFGSLQAFFAKVTSSSVQKAADHLKLEQDSAKAAHTRKGRRVQTRRLKQEMISKPKKKARAGKGFR
mmetsp:Transcript_41150/g.94656  ORF Transcript_41150/g.94656 Transcript_41150/m.94656 type:complete len:264 (-) Transcript_41150:26-817(-)